MIKVGIIGCGKIAQTRHIPEYLKEEDVKLVALYDMNSGRAAELAKKYSAKASTSVEELLGEDLDAVSICTANSTHADLAIKALERGFDVLCEKPMAMNENDCLRMTECAKRQGKILMIGQNQRLTPTHVKARDLIKGGKIGRVVSFSATFAHGGPETWSVDPGASTWFFDKSKAVMGAMADLGIHKTDLLNFILDDEICAVTARLGTLDKMGSDGALIAVDDNAFCIYETKKGAVGIMRASWTNYGSEDNSTVIYGTEGVLKIYLCPEHSIILERKDGGKEFFDIDQIQTNDNQTDSGIIKEFVASIKRGYAEISAMSVLPAMRAVFKAVESSESGRRIEF